MSLIHSRLSHSIRQFHGNHDPDVDYVLDRILLDPKQLSRSFGYLDGGRFHPVSNVTQELVSKLASQYLQPASWQ